MKKTVRSNIDPGYSLHDMNVIEFKVDNDSLIMYTQSGIVKTTPPLGQYNGCVEFNDVRWDFSYVYMLGIDGNIGKFSGQKMYLKDFIDKYKVFGFSIVDETYGYNMTKYNGYFKTKNLFCECNIEIYHEGDMFFVAEK